MGLRTSRNVSSIPSPERWKRILAHMSSTATTLVPLKTREAHASRTAYHWPEYLIEAGALGTFMLSACTFSADLEHPASPLHQAIASEVVRRCLLGVVFVVTTSATVYSGWGS